MLHPITYVQMINSPFIAALTCIFSTLHIYLRVHAHHLVYTHIHLFDISDYMQLINSPFIAALTYVITNFLLFQKPLITVAKCPRCQTEQVCCKFLHKYSAHARTHTLSVSLSLSLFLCLSLSLSVSLSLSHTHTLTHSSLTQSLT